MLCWRESLNRNKLRKLSYRTTSGVVNQMTDPKQLIERYCRQGDQSAFSAFYRQQADRLWRFLVARGCHADGAYDLLSEVFLKFIQAVCKDPRFPVALLYRIAVNAHIDRHRRQVASPVVFDSEQATDMADPQVRNPDDHDYVKTLMDSLPQDEQNLLLMRYWIGLTHKEVANITGMPEGTVRRQTAAAIKKLRQRWGEEA